MNVSMQNLPDDLNLLKQIILQHELAIVQRDEVIAQNQQVISIHHRIIAERERMIAEHDQKLAEMEARHKAQMDALLRRFYGPRSEKFDPRQLLFFGITVAEMPVDEKVVEAEAGEKRKSKRINHKHGRAKLPESLPRHEIIHDLAPEEKKCPCCGELRTFIGSEISEQLEMKPFEFFVLKHVRNKYMCTACSKDCEKCDSKAHFESAAKPAAPIEKGLPGPGLLAHIIVSKLGDHLPLYRLEDIFSRVEVSIARSTMCGWMMNCSELVKPLVELMKSRVKQSKVIHTDDTTVKVQDRKLKGRCRTARVWCYLGDEDNPYDVFDFSPDRKREHPQNFLEKFTGHLQADAYGGYDGIFARKMSDNAQAVIEVACWAHARRKFFEAKETDGKRSAQMLEMIRQLYAVEDEARAMTHDARRELRKQKSVPILATIKTWLDTEKPIVVGRSKMHEAITYALNQWEALSRYVEQGYLNIDNNAAERALKRVAIGRKNWLFAGHDEAGKSHARLWTLIASALRHGLDPQKYMRSVLAKIGQTNVSEIDQFLPDVWKAEDAYSLQ